MLPDWLEFYKLTEQYQVAVHGGPPEAEAVGLKERSPYGLISLQKLSKPSPSGALLFQRDGFSLAQPPLSVTHLIARLFC